MKVLLLGLVLGFAAGVNLQEAGLYRRSSGGTLILENDGGTSIKVLVDK